MCIMVDKKDKKAKEDCKHDSKEEEEGCPFC